MKPIGKEAFACLFAAALLFAPVVRAGEGPPPDGNAVDDESARCLSCHDPAALIHHKLSVCFVDDGCDHPVGGDYARLASDDDAVRQAPNLDPAIKLKNGKLACTTCHISYEDAERHRSLTALRKRYPLVPDPMLAVDNRENQLCLSCHNR